MSSVNAKRESNAIGLQLGVVLARQKVVPDQRLLATVINKPFGIVPIRPPYRRYWLQVCKRRKGQRKGCDSATFELII